MTEEQKKMRQLSILVIGLDGSGKTTLTKLISMGTPNLTDQHIITTIPTHSFTVASCVRDGVRMVFRDFSGAPSKRRQWLREIEKSDVIVFMVDAADLKRRQEAVNAFDDLITSKEFDSKGPDVIVVANMMMDKYDAETCALTEFYRPDMHLAIWSANILNNEDLEMLMDGIRSHCPPDPDVAQGPPPPPQKQTTMLGCLFGMLDWF